MKTRIFTLFIISIFVFNSQAQSNLYVDTTITAEQMVMDFFDGECVTVSNITYTGDNQSKGYFEGANTNVGIPAGMLLSSGRATNAIGPNTYSGVSYNSTGGSDNDLSNISGFPTNDVAVLEFDLLSDADDTLSFYYAFGSDEYPEFAGTTFNDVFAFFVDGAGYNGMTNIALLPDGSTPVTINNANDMNNSMYYVDNAAGQDIEYDGFTIELEAPFVVQANETYHIKIAVADVGDEVFDSGVFLGIESLCGDSLLTPPAQTQFNIVGNTISFANQSLYATDYFWEFGDGNTSTDRYPDPHTYAADGYYTVSLTTQNYCCSDTWSTLVPIGNVVDIDANSCETDDYQLSATSPGAGEQGQWSVILGDGTVADIENPDANLNNPSIGINMLEWRITEQATGNLILADTFVLNINENPEASIITDIAEFCENDPAITIEVSPSGGTFMGPVTGNVFDPAQAGPGIHEITYQFTTDQGCFDMEAVGVEVFDPPVVSFDVPLVVCENTTPILLTGFPDGGVFEGPGISGDGFDPAQAGLGTHEITYTYTDLNGCSNSLTQIIEVNSTPNTPFIMLIGADSLSASVVGDSYIWYLNGAPLFANTQQIPIQGDGEYTVSVISQNGCASEFSQVFLFTGIFDPFTSDSKRLELYPNPVQEMLFVQFPEDADRIEIEPLRMFNTLGQLVETVQWAGNRNSIEHDIKQLKPGLYYIQASTRNSTFTGSFIKQ